MSNDGGGRYSSQFGWFFFLITAVRVFITGMDGFTGRYLAAALRADGHEVWGLTHDLSRVAPSDGLFCADLVDAAALSKLLKQLQPDWVIHLAAISFAAH